MISTECALETTKLDVAVFDKKARKCLLIDAAVPNERPTLIYLVYYNRLDKLMWNVHVTLVPVIIGALGSMAPNVKSYIKKIGIKPRMPSLQKSVLLGT